MDDSSTHVTVTDDGVEVQRTIDERPTATVAVYRLQTAASTPQVVHLEEATPPRDSIETLEFHPEHLPNDWTRGDGAMQFEVIVPPNETRVVVLGLEATDDAPFGREEPTVSHLDLETDDLPEPDDVAGGIRGGETNTLEVEGSSVLDNAVEAIADGGDAATDSTPDETVDLPDPDDDEVLDLPDPNGDEATTGPETEPSAGPVAVDEAEPSSDVDSDGEASDVGDHSADSDDGPGSDDVTDSDNVSESDGADPVDAPADLGLEGFDSEPSDASLVSDLLADIRAGNASDDELEALRSELGVGRADEVRFRHVQSRMDDFAAYVDALEGIIDSHGTASEFVEGIERQVTDLEAELGALRAEVGTLESGLEAGDDERERLTGQVADLEASVEDLTAEVAGLREAHADRLDRLESDIDAVSEELEADVDAELASLREDVESFNELRQTLLDAFGTGLELSSDDSDTER